MAGHNKWSKVKRLKAVTDGRRSKVFSSLSREITLAAKTGGGDPDGNARLRTLLLKAREANMPAENLDRAIKKGTGELPGIVYESMTYEAYGPGGVAFVVQVTTDNKVRAAKDLRSIFARHGGNLAATGAVMFQFLHAGQFLIPRNAITEDALTELALEAGADDIITTEDGYELRCAIHAFDRIAHAFDDRKIKPAHAELAYISTTTVAAPTGHLAKELAELHASLDALDDVQHIFSNEAE